MRFLFLILHIKIVCLAYEEHMLCASTKNYMRNSEKDRQRPIIHSTDLFVYLSKPRLSVRGGGHSSTFPFQRINYKWFTQQWNVCVRINDESISITTGSRRDRVWCHGPRGWEIMPKGRLGQTGWFPYCTGVQKSCFLSLQSSAAVWHTHTQSLWTCFRASTGKTGLSPSSNLRSLASDYSQCLIKHLWFEMC